MALPSANLACALSVSPRFSKVLLRKLRSLTLTLSRSAQIRDLGATQSHKEVGFGHFEGLSLGTIFLESAETFTLPFSAHGSLREFLKTRRRPSTAC